MIKKNKIERVVSICEKDVDYKKLEARRSLVYRSTKRGLDIIFAILGVAIMLPVAIIVKIISICYGDYNSIIYKHTRIGKNGQKFQMYKFRTMVPNSKEILDELLKDEKYRKEWEKNQKFENDPRITKIGSILRKTSIDELPQFLNILKNDMSLIGPRPLVPGELEAHNGNPNIYQKVKPGITSWWASHGRSAISYEDRLNLEYYYIQNRSFILDMKCIFATIKAVLMKTGAK